MYNPPAIASLNVGGRENFSSRMILSQEAFSLSEVFSIVIYYFTLNLA